MNKVRVWDLPTRLFHWLLVISVCGALVTQYLGGTAMEWHFKFGYVALGLVIFRLIWGLIGPRYARFASFVRSPSAIAAHLRGLGAPTLGHNPLGALSVLAMLGVVLIQAGTGLFSNDEISAQGPLAKFIDEGLSGRISEFHGEVSGTLIYALLALHIVAIVFYRLRKKQNLVGPMISGDQLVDASAAQARQLSAQDGWRERALALACAALSAAVVWFVVNR
jgi:cytochrome b